MPRAFIISEQDGHRVPVGAGLTLGRTAECGLVVDDPAASRKHMEIRPAGGRFLWKDLGSSNGTLLNGSRMLEGELKQGDKIRIGEAVFLFEIEVAPAPEEKKAEPRFFQETIMAGAGVVQETPEAGKTAGLLEAVYAVANEIATNYDPCSLMDSILETTMRAIKAQRGAIFLAGPDESLLPCPQCQTVHHIHNGVTDHIQLDGIKISQSVATRVLRGGESVLYQDTDGDAAETASASIMSLKLHSIVCVPLRAKHGIQGILYMDSDRANVMYTQEDMLLAAAVGNSAGIALENARMHLQILEKQRIEQEIETAWTIQEGFLVKEWPETDPRFQVYAETRPAKTVGGDFYDFVQTGPNSVGVLIGDVSGKGVPAALTMAQLLAQFRLYARTEASPAAVLHLLNKDLAARSRRGMFCTLFYLVLDLDTGAAQCANAGHGPALRISCTGAAFFAEASGPPAGILAEGPWADTPLQLDAGDSLLLLTDGILEARAAVKGEDGALDELGETRLAELAVGLAQAAPQVLLDAINAAVTAHCAPAAPHDDCTMLALKYLGHGN